MMTEEEQKMIDELIAHMRAQALTPEYMEDLRKRIEEENERYEEYEREQRRLWHLTKDIPYDI